MTHEIKIKTDFVDAVLLGDKTFEVRKNDRGYQKGDYVKFKPLTRLGLWDENHPLNNKTYEITYVLSDYGIQPGYVVFEIKEVKKSEIE